MFAGSGKPLVKVRIIKHKKEEKEKEADLRKKKSGESV